MMDIHQKIHEEYVGKYGIGNLMEPRTVYPYRKRNIRACAVFLAVLVSFAYRNAPPGYANPVSELVFSFIGNAE